MGTEVVEEMIATLGLDSSKFTAGQKAAADSMQSFRASVMESSEGMGASLGSLATKFSGFFLGVASLAGAIDIVKNMAFELKNLGIQAEALGTTGQTLRVMQQVSELAGAPSGAMANYAQSGLSSIYSMVYGGIPQWAAPAMLGYSNPMAFWGQLASAQTPKQEKSIYMGLAEHLQNSPQAAQFGESMGLSRQAAIVQFAEQVLKINPAIAVLLTNTKQLSDYFDKAASDNKSIQQRQIEIATHLADSMISLKYQVEEEATKAFPALSIAVTIAEDALQLLDVAASDVSELFDDIANGPFGQWLKKEFGPHPAVAASTMTTGQAVKTLLTPLTSYDENVAAVHQIANAGFGWLGRAVADTTSMAHGNLLSDVLGGISVRSLDDVIAAHSAADVRNADVLKSLSLPPIQGAAPSISAPGFSPLPLPTALGLPQISMMGGSQSANSLHIGSMTINSNATDSRAVGRHAAAEIARKFNVTQADSGVVV